jgi:prepilin-type N-terminal cleavage/methylation domain-containing protein
VSKRPRSERGDTLVEVIVSIVILAIVTAGLLAGMTTTTASSNIGRQQADAEALLTSAVEAVKDPTQFPYDCSGNYDIQSLAPAGWTVAVVNTELWDGTTFAPVGSPCSAQMQDLKIQVQSPGGLTWTRDVIRGEPR